MLAQAPPGQQKTSLLASDQLAEAILTRPCSAVLQGGTAPWCPSPARNSLLHCTYTFSIKLNRKKATWQACSVYVLVFATSAGPDEISDLQVADPVKQYHRPVICSEIVSTNCGARRALERCCCQNTTSVPVTMYTLLLQRCTNACLIWRKS